MKKEDVMKKVKEEVSDKGIETGQGIIELAIQFYGDDTEEARAFLSVVGCICLTGALNIATADDDSNEEKLVNHWMKEIKRMNVKLEGWIEECGGE